MNAKELSITLAETFLRNGNYEALGSAIGYRDSLLSAPAMASNVDDQFDDFTNAGFSGLAVHSVGFTSGSNTEEVIIYVTKGSQKLLRALPDAIDQIPVVAKVMGKLQAIPAPAMAARGLSHFYEVGGRIACGGSCAPSGENYAGTLGALMTDGTRMFALSNNHVFAACNHMPIGMPILAPATMDAKPDRRAPSEICRHEKMIELRSGDPRLVPLMTLDAAAASVSNDSIVTSWQGDAKNGYDTPTSVIQPRSGLRVKKFGRTTGLTFGVIEAFVPTPWVLPYKSSKFSATVWFKNTWTIRTADSDPFALPGDSGSLIVTEDGQHAVGLLFAVNNRGEIGIIMPIDDVLSACGGLQLVSGHGI